MSGSRDVKAFLRSRGCPEEVVRGGLERLVGEWERIAGEVARGYALGLDDYLNDLDVRQLIEDAAAHARPQELREIEPRLLAADERMQSAVRPVTECLWGERVARREGWSADSNWWYFSLPRRPGRLLREELEPGG
jgi:hypothetical protein